jgi:hypothetical protein
MPLPPDAVALGGARSIDCWFGGAFVIASARGGDRRTSQRRFPRSAGSAARAARCAYVTKTGVDLVGDVIPRLPTSINSSDMPAARRVRERRPL